MSRHEVMLTIEDIAKRRLVWAKQLLKKNEELKEVEGDLYTELSNLNGDNEKLEAEVERLRKREATFDTFIDSLDVHNEHEWMLIERIDEIHERLHGGEEE